MATRNRKNSPASRPHRGDQGKRGTVLSTFGGPSTAAHGARRRRPARHALPATSGDAKDRRTGGRRRDAGQPAQGRPSTGSSAATRRSPASRSSRTDPIDGASTVTEDAMSPKVGHGKPVLGHNPGNQSLDRARVDSSGQVLTTNMGVAVADNQNSLKAGLRGPTLMEDFILREKITHFDHERIPERIVHARGSAAHGYFESYQDLRRSRARRRSPPPASARRCSCASRRSPASAARPTSRATCAASRSSSTPTKATGTSSATTSRCSSSRTR